jgi:hypothetical protein
MADYESGGMGVNLRVVPPYDFYFQYYYGGYTMLYTNIETSLNTIYSISVTNDVTNNRLFIYMNGNKVMDIESVNIISGPTQNTRLAIGNNPNGSSVGNAGLRGKYYCLRVYNQSLTEQQVLNN